jgi:uncharacterized protein (TIGR00369 family)
LNSRNDVPAHTGSENILRHTRESLVRNRRAGFHFLDNFLGLTFNTHADAVSHASMAAGEHCTDANGDVVFPALCVLADMALGRTVYAAVDRRHRLATVSLQLQFSGVRPRGHLDAQTTFHGFSRGGLARQGLTRLSLRSANEEVCFGNGSFIVLEPPPGFRTKPRPAEVDVPDADLLGADLSPVELAIMDDARAALERTALSGEPFFPAFLGINATRNSLGAICTVQNTPQLGNRVGHVQGGILLSIAEITARTALPAGWLLQGITACYVRPGNDSTLTAQAQIVHLGKRTAAVRSVISDTHGRPVLETLVSYIAAGVGR